MTTKSEEFSTLFQKSLARSCKYFIGNETCSKKPKTYLGMFSQDCAMYKGGRCDAHDPVRNVKVILEAPLGFDIGTILNEKH